MAYPQSRSGAMAPLDGMYRHGNSPRSPTTPTIEQLLQEEEAASWSPHSSPTFWRDHDMEYDHAHTHKKSVLAKVRDKAKKWRNTLSKKKHGEDGNTTPSWGVSLDDDEEEEDPEYFGAPMYESEMAPEAYKETARQHPRAIPVISEKHVLPSSVNHGIEEKPASANKTLTETMTEKLAPAYATVSDATHAIASKIQSLAFSAAEVSPPNPAAKSPASPNLAAKVTGELNTAAKGPASPNVSAIAPGALNPAAKGKATLAQVASTSVSSRRTAAATPIPAVDRAPPAATTAAGATGYHVRTGDQIWDKGVSVKEYIMHKLEPGEDERALSQVISQAINPRKTPGEGGVVEKMKEAVTSLLRSEEYSQPAGYHSAKSSFSHIPISTNAHEVEEETHGRILQPN